MLKEFDNVLNLEYDFVERTADVGITTPEVGVNFEVFSGPTLRASGISHDLRKDEPWWFMINLILMFCGEGIMGSVGDCWDRYW